ncbi:hypothetical protein SOM28_16535 [Massilia sp. CFBP9026]|nr:hypothetical protein [Massilia sp. CFBP9026]
MELTASSFTSNQMQPSIVVRVPRKEIVPEIVSSNVRNLADKHYVCYQSSEQICSASSSCPEPFY